MASQKRSADDFREAWGIACSSRPASEQAYPGKRVGLLLSLSLLALVVPSAHVGLLDGIPFDSFTEVLLVVVFVISTACLKAHRVVAGFLQSRRRISVALLAGLVVLIPVRLFLFASSDNDGVFRACYRPANEWAGDGTCEASYENFARKSETRFDAVIDFGEKSEALTGVITNTNWNLGFVNDLRFNVYPWEEGNPDLIRFPFSASWNGQLHDSDTNRALRVTYIGDGTVTLGTQTTRLEESYGGQATTEVLLPAGETSFELEYTFDSLVSRSEPTIPGPYGQLKVEVRDGNSGDWQLLRAADVGIGIRLLAVLNDLVFVAAILGLAYIGLKQNRRTLLPSGIAVRLLLLVCSLSAGTLASTLGVSLPMWWIAVIAAGSIGVLLRRSREALRLSLPLMATVMAFNIATRIFPSIHYVDFKGRGDDWMTYEHFARSILIERSLEGAESVFYYQPAFRYMLFGAHLLFGDGAWGVAFLLAILFTGSLAYLIWRVSRLHFGKNELQSIVLVGAFTLAALLFLHADSTLLLLRFHATEIPTWGLILGVAGLLIPSTDRRRIALASGLPGASLTWPIVLFAALWLTGFVLVVTRLPRAGLLWGLLAVPVGYLTTMVLYDVLIYYPRHIVAFNLALGLFGTTVALMTLNPTTGAPAGRQPPRPGHRRNSSRE